MDELKLCFNERKGNLFVPDPQGEPDQEITPEIEAALKERNNGFFVHLDHGLGIQFENMADYLTASDAYNAKNWPFTPYKDIPTNIPAEIHSASVMTQMLTGYSAIFLTQKNFMESSFRADVGNTNSPYGYMQLTPDAVREGADKLLDLPTADLIIGLVPELAGFKNGFGGDTELEAATIDALRESPLASTLLAAGYNIRYSESLTEKGIELRAGHGYLLHFLGPGNFKNFSQAHAENPEGIALEALNGGAESPVLKHAANRAIFFKTEEDGTQTPRTLEEIFEFLDDKKNLSDHKIMRRSAVDMECLEILTGQEANERAAEVQRPDGFMPKFSGDSNTLND